MVLWPRLWVDDTGSIPAEVVLVSCLSNFSTSACTPKPSDEQGSVRQLDDLIAHQHAVTCVKASNI